VIFAETRMFRCICRVRPAPARPMRSHGWKKLVGPRERLVADAAVFPKILRRDLVIDGRDLIQEAFDRLLGVVDQVLEMDPAATERAKEIRLGRRRLSARDAVHVAVMERHDVDRILPLDASFGGLRWRCPTRPTSCSQSRGRT
jgi:uncharacterized protein